MKVEVLTPVLDRLIAEHRVSLAKATEVGDWSSALEATLSGLLWRSVRLANSLHVLHSTFDPREPWQAQALKLRHSCLHLIDGGSSEPDYKVEVLVDVLDAIMDVVGALEAKAAGSSDQLTYLALCSGNLGRCEVMLGFAEEGFWEQIYEWRKRQGGRRKGYLAPWKKEAASVVNGWIAEEPDIKLARVTERLLQWLEDKQLYLSEDAVKSGLKQMRKAKMIHLQSDRERVN